MRVDTIVRALDRYEPEREAIRGVGFCVTIRHARFMADAFNRHGIASAAYVSDVDRDRCDTLLAELRSGRLAFLFTVDKFSEGVSAAYRKWRVSFEGLCQVYSDGIADGSLRGDLDVERTADLFFITLRTVANQIILIEDPNAAQLSDNDEAAYFHYLNIFLEAIRAR